MTHRNRRRSELRTVLRWAISMPAAIALGICGGLVLSMAIQPELTVRVLGQL